MKERPILFSAPMVRAILEGRKTQTRRVVKPQPDAKYTRLFYDPAWFWSPTTSGSGGEQQDIQMVPQCPYGVPCDRLWVKETWWMHDDPNAFDCGNVAHPDGTPRTVGYAATMDGDSVRAATEYGCRKRASIHMPRWASRITLEVVSVRVERLQEISEADACCEGTTAGDTVGVDIDIDGATLATAYRRAFRRLWESINGPGSWAANPWVWVVEFKRLEAQ